MSKRTYIKVTMAQPTAVEYAAMVKGEAMPIPAIAQAPNQVPLQDMHYVIRVKGQQLGIAAFAYGVDARAFLQWLAEEVNMTYELVDNMTGQVLATSG